MNKKFFEWALAKYNKNKFKESIKDFNEAIKLDLIILKHIIGEVMQKTSKFE